MLASGMSDPFAANQQLFGADPMAAIVSVEYVEPGSAAVFRRQPDGSTRATLEPFRPFLWNATQGEPLEGGLALKHLTEFPDWNTLQQERARLSQTKQAHFVLNDPVQQFLTFTGRTLFKGLDFSDLRRLQIDVETLTPESFGLANPVRDPIAAIALCDNSGWEELLVVAEGDGESERRALEQLTAIIAERDPDVIEGHNLFRFDLPFLAARARKWKAPLAWGRDGSPLTSRPSRLQIAEKTIQYPKFTVRGRHFADTWILAQHYDVSSRELENLGLKAMARHFGVSDETGLREAEEVRRAYREDESAFRAHALAEARETRALAAILSRSYFIQARIFPFNYQDVMIRGNATKIDALFLREYLRRRHSIPEPPETRPFEGGYTAIFATGVLRDVWHCDVASLYPSVMLAFDYLPPSDQLGILRGMLRDLRAFRLETKTALRASADSAERSRLEALQATFKILINSIYGYLGFAQGHFADFDTAEKITAKGREILKQMVDWLESKGARVIEIDTDGIYFQPGKASVDDLRAGLPAILPEGIEVDFDQSYRAMFSYKAKNYALLDQDGKMIIKGAALKSRGMEPYLRDYLEQLLLLLIEGRAAEAGALQEMVAAQIRSRSLPIEMLAKTEALQDSPAAYQKKIKASSRNRSAAFELAIRSGRDYRAGDQVTYYITGVKKKVVAYENARLISEWNPDARDENVEYYAAKLDELAKKFAAFAPPASEPLLL